MRFAIAGPVLLLLLAVAVVGDVSKQRIPNRLVGTGLLLAVMLHIATLLSGQLALAGSHYWSPLAGALAGGGLLLPLYLLRACGAGDVKLMAMVGAFVGASTVALAVLYTLAAGGLLALAVMLWRGVTLQTLGNIRYILIDLRWRGVGQGLRLAPLSTTAARLPYAVAIAAGTLTALLQALPPLG